MMLCSGVRSGVKVLVLSRNALSSGSAYSRAVNWYDEALSRTIAKTNFETMATAVAAS